MIRTEIANFFSKPKYSSKYQHAVSLFLSRDFLMSGNSVTKCMARYMNFLTACSTQARIWMTPAVICLNLNLRFMFHYTLVMHLDSLWIYVLSLPFSRFAFCTCTTIYFVFSEERDTVVAATVFMVRSATAIILQVMAKIMNDVNNDGNCKITTSCNFLQAYGIAPLPAKRAIRFPCSNSTQNHNSRREIQYLVSEVFNFVFFLFIVTPHRNTYHVL